MDEQLRRVVNVLIVDDEAPPARELEDAFRCRQTETVRWQVDVATSVEQYKELLRGDTVWDVVVVDLKLTPEGDMNCGIDEVISWQMIVNPETIVIVHSAFPSTEDDPIAETVDICVKAMRAGAWSCVKKSVNSADHVVADTIEAIDTAETGSFGFDVSWWNEHRDQIVSKYGGLAIAVQERDVIEVAPTVSELRDKLKRHALQGRFPNIVVVPEQE